MKRRLTESDLTRIVRRVIKENEDENLFHKKTKENGVFISVKETSDGNFEFYVSDDNFNQVHSFYGDRGLAEGVFLQTKLHVQDGKDAKRVFNYIVKKLDSLNENVLNKIVKRTIKEIHQFDWMTATDYCNEMGNLMRVYYKGNYDPDETIDYMKNVVDAAENQVKKGNLTDEDFEEVLNCFNELELEINNNEKSN